MAAKKLTDAELLVLGLVAEMPRHGYQLDQVMNDRCMREWTRIGFSSIYFVLGKLEQMKLVSSKKPARTKGLETARKVYSITRNGLRTLTRETVAALRELRPVYSAVLLGMMHWPVLKRDQALEALCARHSAIESEMARLTDIQTQQQPLPDYVEALFDYSIGQLRAEAVWVKQLLDYMATKPWLEQGDQP